MTKAFVINSDVFGSGSEELGRKLMGNFLRKMWASDLKPKYMVFYNSGVKLLADGSEALDAVSGLSDAGVDLVACGTCISHFELGDILRAGRISDMQEIVEILMACDSVVTV